ncbi:MAG: caspase family protein [Cyclobacteriaceae bacterium]|nr:caspase family protein [Cyclobacteriaceae bacterium]
MSRLTYLLGFIFLLVIGESAAQAPRIVVNPMGHSAKVHNILFTPDGRKIISISEDKTIRVWNAETGEMVQKFESQIGDGPEGMFYSSAISPNGKLLAVAGYPVSSESENYIIIIDLEKNQQVGTAKGHTNVINCLSFSGTGSYLASGGDDNTVRIWKMGDAAEIKTVLTIPTPSRVSSISFNPKTQELAVAHESKDILLFNLAGLDNGSVAKPTPKVLKKHKGLIDKVVYAPDGFYLASSSYENELILWRTDGSVVKEFDKISAPVNAMAFSADSKILVGLDVTGKGMSWQIPAGTKFTDYTVHDNAVFSAAFSPSMSGNYVVASAGGINNEILLWNAINGLTVRRIKGKGSAIQDLAFGNGLELFVSRDFTKNGKPQYKTSFNFGNLSVNRSPGQVAGSGNTNKDLAQTSENSIEMSKGKVVNTDPNIDGRILDYQALPDGSVVVGSDFSLKLFDKNGYLSKEFVGHSGAVRAVTVSADGKYLASGGEDQSIILWKLSETGYAPPLRKAFEGKEWDKFFTSLPVDSLTTVSTKKAWKDVIDFLKSNGNKSYKNIEEVYKTLGEVVVPFATLFITEDNEWVCWTPSGYFSCSSAGSQYFGWHINRGIDKLADFFAAEQYFDILYRPTELEKSIIQGRRVEDILKETGQRIFDLGKLQRPSAGFFDITATTRSTDLLRYDKGKWFTQAKTIPLTVEVFDGGGGVKTVQIYQNDKLIISDDKIKTTGEGQKITKTYEVEMLNEANEFRVKVVNLQRIESRPSTLTIEYTGEAIATTTLHVLAIGINKYQNTNYNLNYARPDAEAFVDKLTEHGKSIFKSINTIPIYDEDATKENIMKGFKSIMARAKPEDVFLFYYAGHGSLDEEHKDENGNSPFYFVPSNVTKLYADPEQLRTKGISGNEFTELLTQIRCQKQIVLTDACHSGGIISGKKVRAAATDERAIVQLARSVGVVWIASSGTKQYATEFDQLQHGAFTYALMEGLDGKADNGDKKVTITELMIFMEDRVPQLIKEYGGDAQNPITYKSGGDFPISILK